MGVWDFISWSTDSVKGIWQSSYDHSSAAISKIDKVVRVDAVEKVNHQLSDPETRSKITRVASELAKNATVESLKAIPGGYTTYKIVTKSLSDEEKAEKENKLRKQEEDLKTLQTTVSRLEKEICVLRGQPEIQKQAVNVNPQNSVKDSVIQNQAANVEPQNPIKGWVGSLKELITSHL